MVEIKEREKIVPVDLGFIVFNEVTYPNLIRFFKHLNVPYEKSDMSFSVSIKNSNIEIHGAKLLCKKIPRKPVIIEIIRIIIKVNSGENLYINLWCM